MNGYRFNEKRFGNICNCRYLIILSVETINFLQRDFYRCPVQSPLEALKGPLEELCMIFKVRTGGSSKEALDDLLEELCNAFLDLQESL